MSFHLRLLAAMEQRQLVLNHPMGNDLLLEDHEDLIRRYFSNYRGADPTATKGLRLSTEGLIVMQALFKHWTITLAADYMPKSRHIIYFDRTATMPWHLEKNLLTLFEPQLAMRAKLVGDLEILMGAFNP